jgi:hypothetical protein
VAPTAGAEEVPALLFADVPFVYGFNDAFAAALAYGLTGVFFAYGLAGTFLVYGLAGGSGAVVDWLSC